MNDIESAIKVLIEIQQQFSRSLADCEIGDKYAIEAIKDNKKVVASLKLAIEALQEKSDRENPQPLTLEQVKERNGNPVYAIFGMHLACPQHRVWCIIEVIPSTSFALFYGINQTYRSADFDDYGKKWLAYDYEPKEQVK